MRLRAGLGLVLSPPKLRGVLVAVSALASLETQADDLIDGLRHDVFPPALAASLALAPHSALSDEDPICTIPIMGEYVLDRDVVCNGGRVQLENGATLDLNGFTIENANGVSRTFSGIGTGPTTIRNGTLLRPLSIYGVTVLENVRVIEATTSWAVQSVQLVSGCYFQGNRTAVDLYYNSDGAILNSTFEDNLFSGVLMGPGGSTLISGNEFRGNRTGVFLWNEHEGGVSSSTISDNLFEENRTGVHFYNQGACIYPPCFNGNEVRGNRFVGNETAGVLLDWSRCLPGRCDDMDGLIVDNFLVANGHSPTTQSPDVNDGITMIGPPQASDGFTISRNVAIGNADLGIEAPDANDGGGNLASSNGDPLECVGVACLPVEACSNLLDDDGDGSADYPDDPGCSDISSSSESPQCQDGIDNDHRPGIDFDGGASLDLNHDGFIDVAFNAETPPVGAADPECAGKPHRTRETISCGLGAELALLLPALMLARSRQRRTH